MSILNWQMDVYNHLRKGLPHTRVFLEGVPENSQVPMDPVGLAKPMVIVCFGQITQDNAAHGTTSDLCGIDDGTSPGVMNMMVETMAPSGLALIQIENAVRRLLSGFQPDGRGQLIEGGMATIRESLPVGISDGLRFYKPLFFSGQVD